MLKNGEIKSHSEIPMTYDPNNIFAKILKGEIPCDKVYEDDFVLAFNDINPQAPVHVLVIPKGQYVSWDDFSTTASAEEITAFVRAVGALGKTLKGKAQPISESGYRLIANHAEDGHQEVPHFHIHILGGKPLGAMLAGL